MSAPNPPNITVQALFATDEQASAVAVIAVDPASGIKLRIDFTRVEAHRLALRLLDAIYVAESDRFLRAFARAHMGLSETLAHQLMIAFRMELDKRGVTDGGYRTNDFTADGGPTTPL